MMDRTLWVEIVLTVAWVMAGAAMSSGADSCPAAGRPGGRPVGCR